MDQSVLDAYDQTRDFSKKGFKSACYAPYTSLYFDTRGAVRVCCQNSIHILGNIAETRLDDIWNGAKLRALRNALSAYSFKLGCRFCEWQIEEGNYHNAFMRLWDEFPVEDKEPQWPQKMEFSVSNTCNLECIMCRGEWSSSIRTRREHLPPLPKAYGEEFFHDLRKYLPHLKQAKFLGGEPFLAQESLRIWEMMVDDGLSIPCHVTTNGTQYNARVERIINALPVSFAISFDGTTKETVEKVRVNANFEEVLANFKRFHAYAKSRGTTVSLTFCLMRQNYHEFGDYCLFADEWGCNVFVNTVIQPPEYGLYTLPVEELRPIVAVMSKQAETILPRLGRNRRVFEGELRRLEAKCAKVEETREVYVVERDFRHKYG